MSRITMRDIPQNDRLYEKCLAMNPDNLGDTELLAVIIRTGSRDSSSLALAGQILTLDYPEGDLTGLPHLSLQESM